jgi:hypothetical protein
MSSKSSLSLIIRCWYLELGLVSVFILGIGENSLVYLGIGPLRLLPLISGLVLYKSSSESSRVKIPLLEPLILYKLCSLAI